MNGLYTLLQGMILLAGLLLTIPIVTLLLECWAAVVGGVGSEGKTGLEPEVARSSATILIPAHNEEMVIGETLQSLRQQMQPADQLVVVADNCNDRTADISRQWGATVLERHNLTQRGKSYALEYGLQSLQAQPPQTIVMIDADCRLEPGSLSQIVHWTETRQRPVQAVYLMEPPIDPSPKDAVSALAFLVRNRVRLGGSARLGMPVLLVGTGMAFPWSVLRSIHLVGDYLVEDMQMAIELAIAGYPPLLCPTAQVWGQLPKQQAAAQSQRTRWEQGHLRTLQTQVPRLLWAALRQGRGDLLWMAMDLSIPPLSLLVMVWSVLLVASLGLAIVSGQWWGVLLFGILGLGLVKAIALAWWVFGRSVLPAKNLLAIPLYLLGKLPIYAGFFTRPETRWIRTERDRPEP